MVDIQPRTTLDESFVGNPPWLVHAERQHRESITLDVTQIKTIPDFIDGDTIKSGIPLRKVGNLYQGATSAQNDVVGLLAPGPHPFGPNTTRVGAALETHGVVNRAAVPGGITAAQETALRHFRFTDHF